MRKNILLFTALLLVTTCVFKPQIEEKERIISGEMYLQLDRIEVC